MEIIKHGIHGIFSIMLILILVVKALYLFELVPSFLAIAGCFAIAALLLSMIFCRKYIFGAVGSVLNLIDKKIHSIYIYIYIIIFAGALISKIILVPILDIVSIYDGSDIQVYTKTAYELAHTGKAQTHAGYCFSYSHIYWFSVFLSPIAKLFGISQTAFSVYLAICASISTLLIFDVLVHAMSPSKAIISIVIYTLLPSQLLLPQFITHEQAMLLFTSITVWLYSRLITQKKAFIIHVLAWFGFLFSLLCAMLVNNAGIVLSIAVCLMFWLFPENEKKHYIRNSLMKCVMVLFFLVAGNSICSGIQMKHSNIHPDYIRSNKYLWTLFVGANTETKASWSAEDCDIFGSYDADASKEEIEAYQKELVINRYQALLRSPDKLLGLIKDKLMTIWALFVYPTGYANETIASKTTAAFYNRYLFKPLALIEYAVMLILTLFHILNLMYKRIKVNTVTFLFELYLMGMTALLLLTECRNKYTISMQIFYIVLCVSSIKQHKNA